MFTQEPGRGAIVLKRVSDLSQVLLETTACLETVGLKSMGLLIVSGNAAVLAHQLASAAVELADESKAAPDTVAVTLPDGMDLSAFADLILDHKLKTAPRDSGKRAFGTYESMLVISDANASRQQLALAFEKCAEHYIGEAEKLAVVAQTACRSNAARNKALAKVGIDSAPLTSFVKFDSDAVQNPRGFFSGIFNGFRNW
ncbi:MAG: hypothetical protein C0507_12280 [Cyanobacteria bacterium PR.3.49]|nr:hypothetical protein [Cyanobacteria bacterium PR.3.49]